MPLKITTERILPALNKLIADIAPCLYLPVTQIPVQDNRQRVGRVPGYHLQGLTDLTFIQVTDREVLPGLTQ